MAGHLNEMQLNRIFAKTAGDVHHNSNTMWRIVLLISFAWIYTTCTGYQGDVVTVTNIGQSSFLSVDSSGVVYATQLYQHTVISVSPQAAVSTIAGSGIAGTANGIGTNAQFNYPQGIAIDSAGSAIFICDQDNHAIRR